MLIKICAASVKGHEALALMRAALPLMDEAGMSSDGGAHLDLAICRLEADLRPQ
jgi:hypothetical protein